MVRKGNLAIFESSSISKTIEVMPTKMLIVSIKYLKLIEQTINKTFVHSFLQVTINWLRSFDYINILRQCNFLLIPSMHVHVYYSAVHDYAGKECAEQAMEWMNNVN